LAHDRHRRLPARRRSPVYRFVVGLAAVGLAREGRPRRARGRIAAWPGTTTAPAATAATRGLDGADHMVQEEDVVAPGPLEEDGALVEGADAPGDAMAIDEEDLHGTTLAPKA